MSLIKNKALNIYSKGAAMQLKMAKIVDTWKDKAGKEVQQESYYLFIDAAKSLGAGDKTYDWKNKFTIRLGIPDIACFLNGFRLGFDESKNLDFKGSPKKFEVYHDPGKGGPTEGQNPKSMSINKGQSYGYMVNFRQKTGSLSLSVPMDDGHMIVLKLLLEEAVKLITGFYNE